MWLGKYISDLPNFIVEIFGINDWTMQTRNTFSWIREEITRSISVSLMIYIITWASISSAYPIFAQQNYENPREDRVRCCMKSIETLGSRQQNEDSPSGAISTDPPVLEH